jgi:GTP-binding protein YchF
VDIAGLVRGAHKGEGLGNRFLGHIRDVEALVHVVRAFEHPQVAHPHGDVDPADDLETVEAELMLADLAGAERRREAATKAARGGDKEATAEQAALEHAIAELSAGRPAPPQAGLLTSKPVLVVANIGEGDEVPAALAARGAVAVCARDEAELGELEPAEAEAMRAELGIAEGALAQIVRAAHRLLGLITFFTAVGDKEVRARSLPAGSTAYQAAGHVHTDMQRGFVRAEVVDWGELVDAGGFAGARERGMLRVEGRDYQVADGNVLHFRFTPP